MRKVLFFLFALLLPALPIRALALSLNDGFNPQGIPAPVSAVALQADGKVIVAGATTVPQPYLSRFNADGTPDSDFHPPVLDDSVLALAVQRDGRILVGGYFSAAGQPNHPPEPHGYLLRLMPNGEIDTSFTPDILPASFSLGFVSAITVQRDGKILIGGSFLDAQGRRNFARLEPTGSLDTTLSLGVDGWVTSIVQQKDDKILVGGNFNTLSNGLARPDLARFNADGTFDAGYSPQITGRVDSLALQSDGAALVGGSFSCTDALGGTHKNLARFRPDGTVDERFIPDPNGTVSSVALNPDDSILVGGAFTTMGPTATPYLARLNRSGAVESAVTQKVNGSVRLITLQPDGKFLIGGNFTMPRRYLARFYDQGVPDADVSARVDANVNVVAAQLDGGVLVGGVFQTVNGTPRQRLARLNPDWTLDTLGTSYDARLNNGVDCIVADPDGDSAFVCGSFETVQGSSQKYFAKINPDGTLDATFRPQIDQWVTVAARQPADGKVLIGGFFSKVNGAPSTRLARLLPDGSSDPGFIPPTFAPVVVNDSVFSIAVLGDRKILVAGGFPQKILRLNENGSIDPGFTPPRFDRQDADDGEPVILDMVQQADGKIVVSGFFTHIDGNEHQYIARLNEDGSLDGSFNVNAGVSSGDWSKRVLALALQTDGRIIMGGDFDLVTSSGITATRQKVARLEKDGTLDSSFDLGPFGSLESDEIYSLALLPDGKLMMSGTFQQVAGVIRQNLARLSNGTATQELKVSREGNEVQWLRGGSSPELWQVTFEESADGRNWSRLGEGARIPGGWSLAGITLPQRENRFVRARGYAGGGKNSTAQLLQSVRAYYLDASHPQTITLNSAVKTYGDSDFSPGGTSSSGLPVSYRSSDPSVAIIDGGVIHITGAGTTTITASQAGDAYNDPAPDVSAQLVVGKKILTVQADNLSRSYGAANPAFTATYLGLVNGETPAVLSGTPALSTAAGAATSPGSYPINLAVGTLSSANYSFTLVPGQLRIEKAPLVVTADNKCKTYGAANPKLTATYTGFVNGETAAVLSGAPALATVAGAGSSVGSYPITAGVGTLNSSNYTFRFVPGTLTIGQATPVITWCNPAPINYGVALGATQLNAVSSVPGTMKYAPGAGTILNVGAGQTLSVTLTPTDTVNYSTASKSVTIDVKPLSACVSLCNLSQTYNGSPKSVSVTTKPSGLAVSVTYNGSSSAPVNAGSYAVVATVSDSRYSGKATGTLTIAKASQSIGAITFTSTALSVGGTTTVSAKASSGLAVSFASNTPSVCTVSGTTVTAVGAGTCSITANQAGGTNYLAAAQVTASISVSRPKRR